MFKSLANSVILSVILFCSNVVSGQVIENDAVLMGHDGPSGIVYELSIRLAHNGGLLAFGLDDLGQGDYRFSHLQIAQRVAAFDLELGTLFDANYALNNTPLARNDNSVDETIVHLDLGESLYVGYWNDSPGFQGNARFDSVDGYGWAEIHRTEFGLLEVRSSATAESLGIVVGTTTQASEPILGDVNQDGATNFLDVLPFIELLSSGGVRVEADLNADGQVDFLDIAPFINLLAGI